MIPKATMLSSSINSEKVRFRFKILFLDLRFFEQLILIIE